MKLYGIHDGIQFKPKKIGPRVSVFFSTRSLDKAMLQYAEELGIPLHIVPARLLPNSNVAAAILDTYPGKSMLAGFSQHPPKLSQASTLVSTAAF